MYQIFRLVDPERWVYKTRRWQVFKSDFEISGYRMKHGVECFIVSQMNNIIDLVTLFFSFLFFYIKTTKRVSLNTS